MILRPGDVYRLLEYDRPAIVVSREQLNRGDYVVVVLVTSRHLEDRWHLPNCVPFRAGRFGFDRDCVAQGETVSVLEKAELDLERGPIGRLSQDAVRDVIRAVGHAIGADCEPA